MTQVTCHTSYVTCHMPQITCHISHFICHVSHVTCNILHVTCLMSQCRVTCYPAAQGEVPLQGDGDQTSFRNMIHCNPYLISLKGEIKNKQTFLITLINKPGVAGAVL